MACTEGNWLLGNGNGSSNNKGASTERFQLQTEVLHQTCASPI